MHRSRSDIAKEHLASQIRDALAEDPRLHALGIDVRIAGDQVHLHGHISGEELRQLAEAIAREVAEGMAVANRLLVSEPAHGPRSEHIR